MSQSLQRGRNLAWNATTSASRLRSEAIRAKYSLDLLLERRLWLFVGIDLLILITSVLEALVAGARIGEIFTKVVLFPTILLGAPAMASVLSLERRAGSLELALSSRSTEVYFLRRIAPVGLCLWAQGWVIVFMAGFGQGIGDLLRALLQTILVVAFVTSATLFWAARLRSSGGVMSATVVTTASLWRWLHTSPELPRHFSSTDRFLGIDNAIWSWTWNIAVVAVATVLLFLYARSRLRRPETLFD